MSSQRASGQVIGNTVNVCIEGVMSVFQSRMRDILDDHGLERPDPQPNEWYPLGKFVQILEVVGEDVGTNAQEKIGEATPQFVEWPTTPESPAEALESLVDVFDESHRNVVADYTISQQGDESMEITSTTPYPEVFEKGLLKGAAEEYGAAYARVEVAEHTSTGKKVFTVSW